MAGLINLTSYRSLLIRLANVIDDVVSDHSEVTRLLGGSEVVNVVLQRLSGLVVGRVVVLGLAAVTTAFAAVETSSSASSRHLGILDLLSSCSFDGRALLPASP